VLCVFLSEFCAIVDFAYFVTVVGASRNDEFDACISSSNGE
jgi:hypothetical protein